MLGITLLFPVPAGFGAGTCPVLEFAEPASDQGLPGGWEPVSRLGKGENLFSLEKEGAVPVLHVKSLNSVSGAMKRLGGLSTGECPVLRWRWKVSRSVGLAVEDVGDRSDAAARVRVIFGERSAPLEKHPLLKQLFEYTGIALPPLEPAGFGIDYLWGRGHPPGTVLDDPHSSRRKMMVLEQGDGKAGRWVPERRNLGEDFRRCFGKEPPGVIAIVLLSDTEDTNEGVEAWFRDFVLTGPGGK